MTKPPNNDATKYSQHNLYYMAADEQDKSGPQAEDKKGQMKLRQPKPPQVADQVVLPPLPAQRAPALRSFHQTVESLQKALASPAKLLTCAKEITKHAKLGIPQIVKAILKAKKSGSRDELVHKLNDCLAQLALFESRIRKLLPSHQYETRVSQKVAPQAKKILTSIKNTMQEIILKQGVAILLTELREGNVAMVSLWAVKLQELIQRRAITLHKNEVLQAIQELDKETQKELLDIMKPLISFEENERERSLPKIKKSKKNESEVLAHLHEYTASYESNKSAILKELKVLLEMPEKAESDNETVKKLLAALSEIQEKAKADPSPFGKTIQSLATKVSHLLNLRLHRALFDIPSQAAAKAPAFAASFALKKAQTARQVAAKQIEEENKIKLERAKIERKPFDDLNTAIITLQKKLNALVVDITAKKLQNKPIAEIEILEKERQELTQTLKQTRAALQALQKNSAKLQHQDFTQERVPAMEQTATSSKSPVFIEDEGVFKMQADLLEKRAAIVADLLNASNALTPTLSTMMPGPIQYGKANAPTLVAGARGIVQPLLRTAVTYRTASEDPTFLSQILMRLDPKETQKKMVTQALLGAWDLHYNNAMVHLIPNAAYQLLDQHHFEYFNEAAQELQEIPLFKLVCYILSGKISEEAHIGCIDKPNLDLKRELREALQSPWTMELFDNERTLGGERMTQSGNPNSFQLFDEAPCLPCRSFFLGTDMAYAPLTEGVKKWLLEMPHYKLHLEKTLSEGDAFIFRHLSNETKALLQKYFDSDAFFFTFNAALGGNKMELLEKLPAELKKRVTDDLKKAGLTKGKEAEEVDALLEKTLFPMIEPREKKALLERLDVAHKYATKAQELHSLFKEPLERSNWTSAKTETYSATIDKALQLAGALYSVRPEQIDALKTEAEKIKKMMLSAEKTGELSIACNQKFIQFCQKSAKLVQPTMYGLYCQIHPQLDFIMDLLARLKAKQELIEKPSQEQLEKIKRELLLETKFIDLASQGVRDGFLPFVSCKKIIQEALDQGVVDPNDPRLGFALEELNKCSVVS